MCSEFCCTKHYYKAIQIVQPQTYTLNSKGRAYVGGQNQTSIDFELPNYTEKWIYKFVSLGTETKESNTTLITELSSTLLGNYSDLLSGLSKPTGVYVCNIDLYEDGNYRNNGSRQMLSSGIVEVIPKTISVVGGATILETGHFPQKITFTNPNTTESIKIQIEIVAIIRDVAKETAERNARQQALNDAKNKQISENLQDIAEAIKEADEQAKIEKVNNIKKEQDELHGAYSLALKKCETKDFTNAILIAEEAIKDSKHNDYVFYYLLGKIYYDKKDYVNSIKHYQKSIKSNRRDDKRFIAYCYGGIGLIHLVQGNSKEANKSYLSSLKFAESTETKKYIAKTIKVTAAEHGTLLGADDIIELLLK